MRTLMRLCEARSRFDGNAALVTYFQEKPYDPFNDEWARELWHSFVHDYLNEDNKARLSRYLGKPIQEVGPDDYYDLPSRTKRAFANWTLEMPRNMAAFYLHHEPSAAPAWMLLEPVTGKLLPKNTPLVHFSDHAAAIKAQGFRFGIPDINQIAITREHSPFDQPGATGQRISYNEPGYNYAYMVNVDLDMRANGGALTGYGADLLLFHSAGMLVHHTGDRENQVVFWGPSASTRNAVVIKKVENQWVSDRGDADTSLNRLVQRLAAP